MSVTSHIECDDCKETLWVGEDKFIYTGEPLVRAYLNLFFQRHAGHRLAFRRSEGNALSPIFNDPTDSDWVHFEDLDYETMREVPKDV